MYTKVMTSKSSSCRMPLSFKSGCGVLYYVLSVLCNVGRYEKYLLTCVLFGSTRQCAGQGRPAPTTFPQKPMHKGPLIGHPLPLRRNRMCQRHLFAAWPPGPGGIRRPKRSSSHCGAGPGCTSVEREPKTPLASLGGPCETSTLATLVRRNEKLSHSRSHAACPSPLTISP